MEKDTLEEMGEFIFYRDGEIVGRVFNDCCAQCANEEGKRQFGNAKLAVAIDLNAPGADEFDVPGRCIRESNRLRWEAATGRIE